MKKDWKLPLKNWMINQKSTNNNDKNMTHQKKIEDLRSILSDTFSYVLSETSFSHPNVLENILAAYVDVAEYVRFIAFRFPDLDREIIVNRLYGLGLHLENIGRDNPYANPNYSAMVKFGEGLQKVSNENGSIPALKQNDALYLENEIKGLSIEYSISDEVTDLFLSKVKAISHNWLIQEINSWEVENEHHKMHISNIDNFKLRDNERAILKESESLIEHLRRKVDPMSDVRSFLDSAYDKAYDDFRGKSGLPYPEDLKEVIESNNNPLLDREKALSIMGQILLEDILAVRSIKPGDKPAPELIPLRDLLIGKKVFKENADIESLIQSAEELGRQSLEGKEGIFHKNFDQSLEETKSALAYLYRRPRLGRAVTMSIPVSG